MTETRSGSLPMPRQYHTVRPAADDVFHAWVGAHRRGLADGAGEPGLGQGSGDDLAGEVSLAGKVRHHRHRRRGDGGQGLGNGGVLLEERRMHLGKAAGFAQGCGHPVGGDAGVRSAGRAVADQQKSGRVWLSMWLRGYGLSPWLS